MVTRPNDTLDPEISALRYSWGKALEVHDINGLAGRLNDIEHKLYGVHYHRTNYDRFEQEMIAKFAQQHTPPAGVSFEQMRPELLFEMEGFLFQMKSCLDMLALLLGDAGEKSAGHTFGDHGDRILKQLVSFPRICAPQANSLKALIESAQTEWIDLAIIFRDEIAHKGMFEGFRCFVEKPHVGATEETIHYPSMPSGERASEYLVKVEKQLHHFIDSFVKIAIEMAKTLRDEAKRKE